MNNTQSQINLSKIVPESLDQSRLDIALSSLLPEYSRARIQEWIKSKYVNVDGKFLKSKDKVATNQTINIKAHIKDTTKLEPQPIKLDIKYEDQDIIVINKQPGLVVHPGAGNTSNTLLNAVLYHYPELSKLPRGGIIHRLDKDTSGLMIIARNLASHNKLVNDLQNREIKRVYEAIVYGEIISGNTIIAPIGRHPTKRTLMAVKDGGKDAITHYRIIKRFKSYTHIRVILETGRTHQIRVHMAYIGHPIVGDPTYTKKRNFSLKLDSNLRKRLEQFNRQALHARCLELHHPSTNKLFSWKTEPPKDMRELLESLKDTQIL